MLQAAAPAGTDLIEGSTGVEGHYLLISGLSGDLTITTTNPAGGRAPLAGFQIVEVPEPSSAALLGLGGLALILRRRK